MNDRLISEQCLRSQLSSVTNLEFGKRMDHTSQDTRLDVARNTFSSFLTSLFTSGFPEVWVMPEEADLAALAKIGPKPTIQSTDPRIPKNIQPYEPDTKKATTMPAPVVPLNRLPGGAPIAPYQLAPTGGRVSPFVPGGVALPQGTWGPAGYVGRVGHLLFCLFFSVDATSTVPRPQ